MCGIFGFVGKSTNFDLSIDLTTQLFKFTEIRGKDASGFWGTDTNGKIYYHKSPTKSSTFILDKEWINLSKNHNLDVLIGHCREASYGVGVPSNNENNHPFVSEDLSIGLVHNGRVLDKDYNYHKSNYNLVSECDSEIILRSFENNSGSYLDKIKSVWEYFYDAQMAVVLGKKISDAEKYLWLFRNEERTLWYADLTDFTSQIYFFSTPFIWQQAVNASDFRKEILNYKIKLVEIPSYEVWELKTLNGKFQNIERYELEQTNETYKKDYNEWDDKYSRNFDTDHYSEWQQETNWLISDIIDLGEELNDILNSYAFNPEERKSMSNSLEKIKKILINTKNDINIY